MPTTIMRDVFGRKRAASISPTWLAWPTLTERAYGPEAVGTTHHVPEITAVLERWGPLFTAELVVEREGQFAGAVRVRVGGVEVGSVPRDQEESYRVVVNELTGSGSAATCRITASPGVNAPWLMIHGHPALRENGEPFLPPTGVDEYVELAAGQAEVLDASLYSRAKLKHVYCGVALSPSQGWIGVALEGVPTGRLVGEYPLVRAAEQAGFPLTARAMLRRDPDRGFRLQVFAPVTY